MATEVIRTENITKHFKDVRAVSDMSLTVNKGEIYGFLGLNGAGKTTTIRMLLGLIKPTSGNAFIDGQKVSAGNTEILRNLGTLVEMPYAYPELTVRENLEIFRRLHFLSDKKAVDKIIRKMRLEPYADRKAKNLSLGNNQRLGLAKALIHEPEILILDEPANGLDPAGIFEIREMLRDLALNQGVTVFISSHILDEISRFATRIGIIHQGQLIQEIDSKHLETLRKKRLAVNAADNEKAKSVLVDNGYSVSKNNENQLEVTSSDAIERPDKIAALLVNSGCPPLLLKVEEEDLETYFLRIIGVRGGAK